MLATLCMLPYCSICLNKAEIVLQYATMDSMVLNAPRIVLINAGKMSWAMPSVITLMEHAYKGVTTVTPGQNVITVSILTY